MYVKLPKKSIKFCIGKGHRHKTRRHEFGIREAIFVNEGKKPNPSFSLRLNEIPRLRKRIYVLLLRYKRFPTQVEQYT